MVEVAVWPAPTSMLVGLAVTEKLLTVSIIVAEAVEQQCVTSEATTRIVQVVMSVLSVALAVNCCVPEPMTL